MRTLLSIVIIVVLLGTAPAPAEARRGEAAVAHPFGVGLELGAPTGLAAKYYFGGNKMAVQGGLGVVESVGDDGIHVHAEVVWHPAILTTQPAFTMPFYLGVGARLLQHDDDYCRDWGGRFYCDADDDTHLGLRAPFGLLLDFKKIPLDVFLELALVVDLIHLDGDDYRDHDHDALGVNLALGARYYF